MSDAKGKIMAADLTVANEIKRQLGAQTLAMLGASMLVGSREGWLMFAIKGSRRINKIKIILTPADVYRVEFWKITVKGCKVELVKAVDGVYCDSLHDVIESATGLYTTLCPR